MTLDTNVSVIAVLAIFIQFSKCLRTRSVVDEVSLIKGQTSGKKKRTKDSDASKKNGFWKKQVRTWHWISGAICLAGMLMFSLTGLTLNHAKQLTGEPVVTECTAVLPDELRETLLSEPVDGYTRQLKEPVRIWISDTLDVYLEHKRVEWTEIDAYVLLERPGGAAWLSVDRETGEVTYELTTRGTIAFLNDLHKGHDTGPAWDLFIDIFSVASVLFCLTGLWLLQMHAGKRPSTWWITLAGILLPVLLALISVH